MQELAVRPEFNAIDADQIAESDYSVTDGVATYNIIISSEHASALVKSYLGTLNALFEDSTELEWPFDESALSEISFSDLALTFTIENDYFTS